MTEADPATNVPTEEQETEALRHALLQGTQHLEQARCQESELEAWTLFSSALLQVPPGHQQQRPPPELPALQDAWQALLDVTGNHNGGQWATAVHRTIQAASIHSMAQTAARITSSRLLEGGPALDQAVLGSSQQQNNPNRWLKLLDERLQTLRAYHARHGGHKRQRADLEAASILSHKQVVALQNETLFSSAEVLGKYLDLQQLNAAQDWWRVAADGSAWQYTDFLKRLAQQLDWPEATKLRHRKPYRRFLVQLQEYLQSFLQRTTPLLDVSQKVIEPALEQFHATWRQSGGIPPAWQAIPAQAVWAEESTTTDAATKPSIDLSKYATADELATAVDGDQLKAELARLGLKCGGTVQDRAKRLFWLKSTPLDELPDKLKKAKKERRIDLARLEATVLALLHQVRPILEATIRRSERQLGQTIAEREREIQEEWYGSATAPTENKNDDSDNDSDAPIYNPKNVPLDWDGKPMPYWLFKLHGLNHYYPCEICGGERYRGRRNFELHFADPKHTAAMKSLGIPNTKHFHGVTQIADAVKLWETLNAKVEQEHFDDAQEEEYEDSHGNVLSRSTYEDLARQGLL